MAEPKILMILLYFLAASVFRNYKKAVVESAASAASSRGGCASSRLDHDHEITRFLGRLRQQAAYQRILGLQ